MTGPRSVQKKLIALAMGAFFVVGFAFSSTSHAYEFPRVKGLEPAVAFWKNVYAVWSINEIALHDDKDFSIVYTVVKVPKRGTKLKGKTRGQTVKQAKIELIKVLASLAKKKPNSAEKLSGLEKEVFVALQKVKRRDKYKRKGHIRAQNGLRERFRYGWINAGAFESEVRRQLKVAGHPGELVALAYVESLMSLKVKSYAGAQGIWQFMPATGREYMNINEVLDERHDPILATVAAGKYINTALKRVGPWPVAITSYNYGRAGVRRLIKKAGSKDLSVLLKISKAKRFGFAARNYYASFLAVTEVLSSPTSHFRGAKQVAPWSYDVVRLPFPMKVPALTKKGAVTAKDLKRMNPAIRTKVRKGSAVLPEGFPIRIPRGTSDVFLSKLKGTKVKKKKTRSAKNYKVRPGDSLFAVAKKFKVTRTALAQANGISRNAALRRGQRLKIPPQMTRYSLFPEAINMAVPRVAHDSVLVTADESKSGTKKSNAHKRNQKLAAITSKKSKRAQRHKKTRNSSRQKPVERVKVTLVSAVSWKPSPKKSALPPIDTMVGALPLPPIDVLSTAGVFPVTEPLDVDSKPVLENPGDLQSVPTS
ncbi:MAG: transglycosylase SLT domain-containing protein [Deltaproteobacteria bacterium]|nr:transglycosylase SLT domain-containing protein [Deltaproteobacteria bacterium]